MFECREFIQPNKNQNGTAYTESQIKKPYV